MFDITRYTSLYYVVSEVVLYTYMYMYIEYNITDNLLNLLLCSSGFMYQKV